MRCGSIKKGASIVALLSTLPFAASQTAQAGMRVVSGQAYWEGDPGPVNPWAYWTSGQYAYDPHHYNSWFGSEPQTFKMTVYAEHTGEARCVWRSRVINSNWEFRHPYLRVCRPYERSARAR